MVMPVDHSGRALAKGDQGGTSSVSNRKAQRTKGRKWPVGRSNRVPTKVWIAQTRGFLLHLSQTLRYIYIYIASIISNQFLMTFEFTTELSQYGNWEPVLTNKIRALRIAHLEVILASDRCMTSRKWCPNWGRTPSVPDLMMWQPESTATCRLWHLEAETEWGCVNDMLRSKIPLSGLNCRADLRFRHFQRHSFVDRWC